MHFTRKIQLAFWLLFSFLALQAQVIEGRIVDKDSETPLDGATVYIDGTTQVAITNPDGTFRINVGNGNNSLVVSYIGYVSYRMENPLQYQNKKLKVFLEREDTLLEEIVIGKSPFSRKEMLEVFRNQFLGTSKAARSCTIHNEDDIVLRFDVSDNTLHATARKTLKINNKYLQYEVNFDLIDFVINYNRKSLSPFSLRQSYFAGSTFYKDISKNGSANKKRIETFLGSAPHLMLAIANESWENEKFRLFVNSFQANPKDYFQIEDTLGIKKIKIAKWPMKPAPTLLPKGKNTENVLIHNGSEVMEKTHFNILYNGDFQSVLDFTKQEVIVDKDGNYSPIYAVLFGGYISSLKAGDMLPRDYYQTVKSKQNN